MQPESTQSVPPAPPLPVPDPVEREYRELVTSLRAARPSEDLAPLDQAYRFAAEKHRGQFRKSGEPFLMHPLQVTRVLADMSMDMVCLETGMLHDVVADTGATLDEVRRTFGDEVARTVAGVTKLAKLNLAAR